ncbi:MAG: hypothetical protein HC802_14230 [Caldilineaceae bacterium]|nr:hypothetical protein [Caldilineaceae bacterium]
MVGVVCTAPLIYALAQNPDLLAARTGDVSIFRASQEQMIGVPDERFLRNVINLTRGFYDYGDLNLRHNLPEHPIHDLLTATLFTLGWLVALWRLREARMRLILLWVAVMALPTLLSTNAPHALRIVGMLPAIALLYALGSSLTVRAASRWIPANYAAAALLALVLVVSGTWTARDYFVYWARDPLLGAAFDLEAQLAAETVAGLRGKIDDEGEVAVSRKLYFTPQMRYATGTVRRHDLEQGAPVPLNQAARFHVLTELDPSVDLSAYLLHPVENEVVATWLDPPQTAADRSLLRESAQSADAVLIRSPLHQPNWPQVVLDEPDNARLPLRAFEMAYPLDVQFANGMELVGYALDTDRVNPGEASDAFLLSTFWRLNPEFPRPDENDFVAFAHLRFGNGQSQQNNAVGSGYPLPLWQPGEIVADHRLLFRAARRCAWQGNVRGRSLSTQR